MIETILEEISLVFQKEHTHTPTPTETADFDHEMSRESQDLPLQHAEKRGVFSSLVDMVATLRGRGDLKN